MQHKDLIIYALSAKDGDIQGIVINGNNYWKQWEYKTNWEYNSFTDLETTQPEPTPTKDTELRLECLKLASNNKNGQSKDAILQLADDYYDWITKNHNQ